MPIGHHYNIHTPARNTQTVDVARATLQAITPIAQQQYDNALKVNGIASVIYSRLSGGTRCTCSSSHEATPSSSTFDEEGNATQEHIQSILTGSQVKIKRYGHRQAQEPANQDTLTNDSYLDINRHIITTQVDDPSGETVLEDTDFIDENPLGAGFGGKCGVCFGTGFVGGFMPQHANRQVFDYSSDWTLVDATRNQSTYPHTLEILSDVGYADLTLILAKGAKSVDCIRLFNNDEIIPQNDWYLMIEGTNGWTLLNTSTILTYCTGLPIKIRLLYTGIFTHLEIQLGLSDYSMVEYPRLNATSDLSVIEGVDSVSLNVGPLVPKIAPWDLILDCVYGKSWLVTDSNWFNDATLNAHGFDVSARLVQDIEIYKLLYQPKLDISNKATILPRRY